MDELDEGKLFAGPENKTNKERLSSAVPHSDFYQIKYNIVPNIEPNIEVNMELNIVHLD